MYWTLENRQDFYRKRSLERRKSGGVNVRNKRDWKSKGPSGQGSELSAAEEDIQGNSEKQQILFGFDGYM